MLLRRVIIILSIIFAAGIVWGQVNMAAYYSYGTDIIKFEPTSSWPPGRQIQSVAAFGLRSGYQMTNHLEAGGMFSYNQAYLNQIFSSFREPINKVHYYTLGGYATGWINNKKRLYPVLYASTGVLLHYPKEIEVETATYTTRAYLVGGLGARLNITGNFRAEVLATSGKTLLTFAVNYHLTK